MGYSLFPVYLSWLDFCTRPLVSVIVWRMTDCMFAFRYLKYIIYLSHIVGLESLACIILSQFILQYFYNCQCFGVARWRHLLQSKRSKRIYIPLVRGSECSLIFKVLNIVNSLYLEIENIKLSENNKSSSQTL